MKLDIVSPIRAWTLGPNPKSNLATVSLFKASKWSPIGQFLSFILRIPNELYPRSSHIWNSNSNGNNITSRELPLTPPHARSTPNFLDPLPEYGWYYSVFGHELWLPPPLKSRTTNLKSFSYLLLFLCVFLPSILSVEQIENRIIAEIMMSILGKGNK